MNKLLGSKCVDDSKPLHRFYKSVGTLRRTDCNTSSDRGIAMLKLTTDRHKALHSLSATAELLVFCIMVFAKYSRMFIEKKFTHYCALAY